MENNKSNKGIIFLLIVLIILVIFLIGLVVYKGFFVDARNDVIEDDITTTSKNIEKDDYTVLWSGSGDELLKKAGMDETTDFSDKTINIGRTNLTLGCTSYNEFDTNTCDGFEILINGKTNNIIVSLEENSSIIVTNDVVVITTGVYLGDMKVLDRTGNKIYEAEIAYSFYSNDDYDNDVDGTPTLIDGKLYFYKQKNGSTLYKNYLDFQNGFDEVQDSVIEGYIGEY